MKFEPLAFFVFGVLLSSLCFAESTTLNLVTFEAPPYQVPGIEAYDQNRVTGNTVDTVECAADQTGMLTRITMLPQNRAIYSLKRDLIDGYFAVAASTTLDAAATRSDPVALDKWYFYTFKSNFDPETARIGVVAGSNEETWLTANGYDVFLKINSPGQLLALLERGRIDAAVMDRKVMNSLYSSKQQAHGLRSYFLRYAPLYLYLSNTYTTKNPDFLARFNAALPSCMVQTLLLTNNEKEIVNQLSSQLLNELYAMLNLQQALDTAPRMKAFADVLTEDSKWRALAPTKATPLAKRVLDLPASKSLLAWQQSHNGLITEVMLINDVGALAAASQLTSDFWQGDEPKFQNVIHTPTATAESRSALYLSPIRYDSSTAQFQITVSAPLLPDNGKSPNGVISFGLNIERALYEGD